MSLVTFCSKSKRRTVAQVMQSFIKVRTELKEIIGQTQGEIDKKNDDIKRMGEERDLLVNERTYAEESLSNIDSILPKDLIQ